MPKPQLSITAAERQLAAFLRARLGALVKWIAAARWKDVDVSVS